jgi:hypothetical protein
MIADQCGPALRLAAFAWAADAVTGHIFAHGSWRDPQTEFEQEFIGDAFLAPRRVLQSHAADQCLQVPGESGASGLGFPALKQAEALTVPTGQGCRFHDHQSRSPVEEAAEPDQCHARGGVGASGGELAGRHLDLSTSGAHSIMLKYERFLFLRTTTESRVSRALEDREPAPNFSTLEGVTDSV